jgi:hypothetical protein
LPGATQRHKLNFWIEEFKDSKDPASGKPAFTRNTEKVATEQLKNVHHASDVLGMDMHQEIPPGPRSTHGLSKWRCDRPESPLKTFHELLAHFGNSGMNKHPSDTLTLGGATEFNIRMRLKAKMNKRKLDGEMVDVPFLFLDLPRHYDNSLLQCLNELSQNCGLQPMFDDVHQVRENNGEVHLSKYFDEQMERNKGNGQDKKTAMCLCPTCTTHMSSKNEEQTRLFAPDDDINDDDNDHNDNNNDNGSNDDIDMQNLLPVVPAAPLTLVAPPVVLPPIPLAELACRGWVPRPHDSCHMLGDCHCVACAGHLRRKISGLQVLGKPPHDLMCPIRRHLQR